MGLGSTAFVRGDQYYSQLRAAMDEDLRALEQSISKLEELMTSLKWCYKIGAGASLRLCVWLVGGFVGDRISATSSGLKPSVSSCLSRDFKAAPLCFICFS